MSLTFAALLLTIVGAVYSAPPEVPCPAPVSPENGQAFLYQDGRVVKYVCEPGYALKGKEIVRCLDGKWEEPNPTCMEFGKDEIKEESEEDVAEPTAPPPPRPLFSWGLDKEQEENEQDINATSEELPLSDEARVRLLMLPRRRVVTKVHTGRIQSVTELEEEEKKRSGEDKADSTTIHLESHPSMVYVKRTVIPGKSETARKSLHMTVENGHDVQLISLPRAAVSVDEKAYQSDETLRQLYWYAHNYPGQVALVDYHAGSPAVMTLTESQLAWINSLHPELRDQYLKDMYVMRVGDAVDPGRVQALVARDAYNYIYRVPYARRPVSLIVDNVASTYDYTCNQAGFPVIPAPDLPNMRVARYDSRKNIYEPHNYYLSAVYQCDPGYYMLDSRLSELSCSRGQWVGISPVCVANP